MAVKNRKAISVYGNYEQICRSRGSGSSPMAATRFGLQVPRTERVARGVLTRGANGTGPSPQKIKKLTNFVDLLNFTLFYFIFSNCVR